MPVADERAGNGMLVRLRSGSRNPLIASEGEQAMLNTYCARALWASAAADPVEQDRTVDRDERKLRAEQHGRAPQRSRSMARWSRCVMSSCSERQTLSAEH